MLDFIVYEDDNKRREIGKCEQCGTSIYTDMNYYHIEEDMICEDCINEYVNNFLVYGDE